MKYYNILEWVDMFENSGEKVDPKEDFLLSHSAILYPGRFYVLEYKATNTQKRYNTRPVIVSMGMCKDDPKAFLGVDLSIMPYQVRRKFIEKFFDMFYDTITKNIDQCLYVEDADKQKWMIEFNYDNLTKTNPIQPIKQAIKKYKIENVRKIYSLPFNKVFKVIGKYCDENHYMNGSIRDVQNEFIQKVRK